MSKKGKKNQGGQDKHHNLNKEEKQETAESKADNKQEMTKIIEAINTMDLDCKERWVIQPRTLSMSSHLTRASSSCSML
jgi:hypothetical protein